MTALSRRQPLRAEACQNCHAPLPPGHSRWCSPACYTEARVDAKSARNRARREARIYRCADCGAEYRPASHRGTPASRCAPCRRRRKAVVTAESDQRRKAAKQAKKEIQHGT